MLKEPKDLISAATIRFRKNSPFFGVLVTFARFLPDESIASVATDGKDIFYDKGFIKSLSTKQLDGVILHEVLHAALLHISRRGSRDRRTWNVAADIVVNGMIAKEQYCELPPGACRDGEIEKLTVEEIYEILLTRKKPLPEIHFDLLGVGDEGRSGDTADLKAYWRERIQQAKLIALRSDRPGSIPDALLLELGQVTAPQLDWRSHLWRFLVQTPNDFQGYERRFIGQGLYIESLSGESLRVAVAVDTSGSIGLEALRSFLGEVLGILNAYPHIECDLYYVDAEAYGPHELDIDSPIPTPQGGGGTSFVPFFGAIEKLDKEPAMAVYLTDGYGDFPPSPPDMPVLWVVTPGGLGLDDFPFGETVRLLKNDQKR